MEKMEFQNYKERQRYFDEIYKNLEKMFFEQPPIIHKSDGTTVKPKGKTYINSEKALQKVIKDKMKGGSK